MSDALWDKIKSLPFPIFSLPHQTVEMHFNRLPITGDDVFLIAKSGAALPMLEDVVGNFCEIEQTDKYLVLKDKNATAKKVEDALAAQSKEMLHEKVAKLTKKK